jgi:hypothetical protein
VCILLLGLASSLERGGGHIWGTVAYGDDAYWGNFVWDPKQSTHGIVIVDAGKARAQSFVYRSEQQYLDSTPGVHVPERNRPLNLRTILAYFVRLLVAAVICFFTRAGDEKYRSLRDPTMEAHADIVLFTTKAGYLLLKFGLCHHYEGLPLSESRARGVPG